MDCTDRIERRRADKHLRHPQLPSMGVTRQQEPHQGRLAVHHCRCTHQAETAIPGTMRDSGPWEPLTVTYGRRALVVAGEKPLHGARYFSSCCQCRVWRRRPNSLVDSSGPPRKCKEIRRRSGAATACCSKTDHPCAEEREGQWLRYRCRFDPGLEAHLVITTRHSVRLESVGGRSLSGSVIKILAGGGGRVAKSWQIASIRRRIIHVDNQRFPNRYINVRNDEGGG